MSQAKEKSYYEVLGLPPNATEAQITKARRTAMLKYHPDKLLGEPEGVRKEAQETFHAIQHACTVLLDPKQRKEYDAALLTTITLQVFANAQEVPLQDGYKEDAARTLSPLFRLMSDFIESNRVFSVIVDRISAATIFPPTGYLDLPVHSCSITIRLLNPHTQQQWQSWQQQWANYNYPWQQVNPMPQCAPYYAGPSNMPNVYGPYGPHPTPVYQQPYQQPIPKPTPPTQVPRPTPMPTPPTPQPPKPADAKPVAPKPTAAKPAAAKPAAAKPAAAKPKDAASAATKPTKSEEKSAADGKANTPFGPKPFKCLQLGCTATFSSSAELLEHTRTVIHEDPASKEQDGSKKAQGRNVRITRTSGRKPKESAAAESAFDRREAQRKESEKLAAAKEKALAAEKEKALAAEEVRRKLEELLPKQPDAATQRKQEEIQRRLKELEQEEASLLEKQNGDKVIFESKKPRVDKERPNFRKKDLPETKKRSYSGSDDSSDGYHGKRPRSPSWKRSRKYSHSRSRSRSRSHDRSHRRPRSRSHSPQKDDPSADDLLRGKTTGGNWMPRSPSPHKKRRSGWDHHWEDVWKKSTSPPRPKVHVPSYEGPKVHVLHESPPVHGPHESPPVHGPHESPPVRVPHEGPVLFDSTKLHGFYKRPAAPEPYESPPPYRPPPPPFRPSGNIPPAGHQEMYNEPIYHRPFATPNIDPITDGIDPVDVWSPCSPNEMHFTQNGDTEPDGFFVDADDPVAPTPGGTLPVAHFCPQCGFKLQGVAVNFCPECGHNIAAFML